ncbi:hypothetical protein [Methanobrevibacter sp.]|uniref:hypothetical protein n=1 Tax=Methanobrevibacter sp. TaxID=66852 RepID=UPI0025FA6994|nr:hypothetical protein [Methanobrevibacter sp.]MBQ2832899.1 hypothetical protein [Methanobrevibacter sp.]
MVDYKTRIFYENETGMLGAEVKLYAEDGENIENIIITSESKFREIADRILEMDDTYIDMEELTQVLVNASNQLQVNATTLQGYEPSDFARALHSHSNYAQTNHSSPSDSYGKGTSNNYGHNKLVNNLTSNAYVDGEALAAYQGKVLSDAIATAKSDIMKWTAITLSGHNNVSDYCALRVNQSLRLAHVVYGRSGVLKGVGSSKNDNNTDQNPSPYWVVGEATNGLIYLHKNGAIPSEYAPVSKVSSAYRLNSNIVVSIDDAGAICINNNNGSGSKSGNGLSLYMQFLYKY